MPTAAPEPLEVVYFDGKSARAQTVNIYLDQGVLHIFNLAFSLAVPVSEVQWPERTRHGKRLAPLAGGGTLQCADCQAWDAWCQAHGLRESGVVALQQSWPKVAGAVVAMVLVLLLKHLLT